MQGDGSAASGIKGQEHLAYINSLPYTVQDTVQVGEPLKLMEVTTTWSKVLKTDQKR